MVVDWIEDDNDDDNDDRAEAAGEVLRKEVFTPGGYIEVSCDVEFCHRENTLTLLDHLEQDRCRKVWYQVCTIWEHQQWSGQHET